MEPSRLPSEPPLGERKMDAAAPRDGDVFVQKLQSRSLNAGIQLSMALTLFLTGSPTGDRDFFEISRDLPTPPRAFPDQTG